jgi:hypothetical protein
LASKGAEIYSVFTGSGCPSAGFTFLCSIADFTNALPYPGLMAKMIPQKKRLSGTLSPLYSGKYG